MPLIRSWFTIINRIDPYNFIYHRIQHSGNIINNLIYSDKCISKLQLLRDGKLHNLFSHSEYCARPLAVWLACLFTCLLFLFSTCMHNFARFDGRRLIYKANGCLGIFPFARKNCVFLFVRTKQFHTSYAQSDTTYAVKWKIFGQRCFWSGIFFPVDFRPFHVAFAFSLFACTLNITGIVTCWRKKYAMKVWK